MKDLTFIHLGNPTQDDGLINFEKLRMIAKEIRHITNMASSPYVRQEKNTNQIFRNKKIFRIFQICWIHQHHIHMYLRDLVINQ